MHGKVTSTPEHLMTTPSCTLHFFSPHNILPSSKLTRHPLPINPTHHNSIVSSSIPLLHTSVPPPNTKQRWQTNSPRRTSPRARWKSWPKHGAAWSKSQRYAPSSPRHFRAAATTNLKTIRSTTTNSLNPVRHSLARSNQASTPVCSSKS